MDPGTNLEYWSVCRAYEHRFRVLEYVLDIRVKIWSIGVYVGAYAHTLHVLENVLGHMITNFMYWNMCWGI